MSLQRRRPGVAHHGCLTYRRLNSLTASVTRARVLGAVTHQFQLEGEGEEAGRGGASLGGEDSSVLAPPSPALAGWGPRGARGLGQLRDLPPACALGCAVFTVASGPGVGSGPWRRDSQAGYATTCPQAQPLGGWRDGACGLCTLCRIASPLLVVVWPLPGALGHGDPCNLHRLHRNRSRRAGWGE